MVVNQLLNKPLPGLNQNGCTAVSQHGSMVNIIFYLRLFMSDTNLQSQLAQDGFVVIKNLLSQEEASHYIRQMEALSGIHYERESNPSRNSLGERGLDKSWYLPDGVSKTADFWPLIFNESLLATVRSLLGEDIRYLQHSDLHVGFSAISWHRDNVCRSFNHGPDWDEADAPYKLLRVGIYLQTYAESHFRLGFIPGSHQPQPVFSNGRKLQEARLKWLGAFSYLSVSFQEWASNAVWIATEPGDCIIFDPRILHSGSYIIGPKYSMFLAYGLPNKHFYNHLNYYQHLRSELGYQNMPPQLVSQLQQAGLFAEDAPEFSQITDAWIPPSFMRRLMLRRRKQLTEKQPTTSPQR
jgi:ectoine hydroxylase-related dioxygenase (phytanoyl-CoA dioxygenase family)